MQKPKRKLSHKESRRLFLAAMRKLSREIDRRERELDTLKEIYKLLIDTL